MDTDAALPELPPDAEARLQELIASQRQRRECEEEERRARRRLWLSHHWRDEYDRCAVVGGLPVCRRCLVLYPIALMVLVVSVAGLAPWPSELDPWLIWALCVPATVDFLAEKLLGVAYSPRRQALVTALVALALGRGLTHELDDRWSWLFWGPVLVFGATWFAAAAWRAQRTMFSQALEASRRDGEFSRAAAVDDEWGSDSTAR